LSHLDIDIEKSAFSDFEHETHLGAGCDSIEEAMLLVCIDVDEIG
jgi:hypothetical protein